MTANLVAANIVIVAGSFNTTIFNQSWLEKNNIIAPNDYDWKSTLFAAGISQVTSISQGFGLLVVPDRLQFDIKKPDAQYQRVVDEKLGKIVNALPETPYTATGLNFHWHIDADAEKQKRWTRDTFFNKSKSIFHFFDTPDARFGGYLSKDELGHRLRLEIKPIHAIQNGGGKKDLLHFAFNFHCELSYDKKIREIQVSISRWNEALDICSSIVNMTLGELI